MLMPLSTFAVCIVAVFHSYAPIEEAAHAGFAASNEALQRSLATADLVNALQLPRSL